MPHRTKTLSDRVLAQALASREDENVFLRLLFPSRRPVELTYSAFVQYAIGWSNYFRSEDLSPGHRVILILPHSADLYFAVAGAILSGVAPSLFAFPSPKHSPEEYFATAGALLSQTDAELVVCKPDLASELSEYAKRAQCRSRILSPKEIDAVSQNELSSFKGAHTDPAFIQFSSGTTGVKKGVAISNQSALWQIDTYARAISLSRDDHIVSWLPLYHDMGFIACCLLPILTRTPLTCMSPFDWVSRPNMLLQAINEYKCSLCWLPNFAYSLLSNVVSDSEAAALDLSSLRAVINCSEPIREESHRAFLEKFSSSGVSPATLGTSYAMAENTFAVTSGGIVGTLATVWADIASVKKGRSIQLVPPKTPGSREFVSSGKPLPQTSIRVVDEAGNPASDGTVGVIELKSPCMLSEYFRNPDATANAIRDGWYHTGDVGFIHERALFVIGRADDVIIVGGVNVFPEDVEHAVGALSRVIPGRTVCFGVEEPSIGTMRLVIMAESEVEDEAGKRELAQEISRVAIGLTDVAPGDIRIVQPRWLKKSTSGKISRSSNRERYMRARATPAANAPDPGGTRDLLFNLIASHSGHPPDDLKDNVRLVADGLIDSITMVSLVADIERLFQIQFRPDPTGPSGTWDTISRLIDRIDTLRSSSTPAAHSWPDVEPAMSSGQEPHHRRSSGFWTYWYKWAFRKAGISVERGLQVHGRIVLRLDGPGRNIRIGKNVTLMPMVDLKIRENGRIILHDGVGLDSNTRLVAANDAVIELGQDVQIGIGTVMNAGADIRIGHSTAIAGLCMLLASEHLYQDPDTPILEQGYRHAPISIGEQAWIASRCTVLPATQIAPGAVIGAGSTVSGYVPTKSIWMGNPARMIGSRG